MRFLWAMLAAFLVASCVAQEAPKAAPTVAPSTESLTEPFAEEPPRARATLPARFDIGVPQPRGRVVSVPLPPPPDFSAAFTAKFPQPSAQQIVATLVAGQDSQISDRDISFRLDGHPWMRWLAEEQTKGAPPQAITRAVARIISVADWGARQDLELIQLLKPLLVASNEAAPLLIDAMCQAYWRPHWHPEFATWAVSFATDSSALPAHLMGTILATYPLPEELTPQWVRRVKAAIESSLWQGWHWEVLLKSLMVHRSPAPAELCEALWQDPSKVDGIWNVDETLAGPHHAPLVRAALEFGRPGNVVQTLRFVARVPEIARAMPELMARHAQSHRPDVRNAATTALVRAGLEVPPPPEPWVMPESIAAALARLAPFDTSGMTRVIEEYSDRYRAPARGWMRADQSVLTDELVEIPPGQRQWGASSLYQDATTDMQDIAERVSWTNCFSERVARRQGMINECFSRAMLWLTWLAAIEPAQRPMASILFQNLLCMVLDESELLDWVLHEMHWLQLKAACTAFEARDDVASLARLDESLRYRALMTEPSGQSGRFKLADDLRRELVWRAANPQPTSDTAEAAVARLRDFGLDFWGMALDPMFRVSEQGQALAAEVLSFGPDAALALISALDNDHWIRTFTWHRNYPRNLQPFTIGDCARWVLKYLCSWHFGVKLEWDHFQPEYRPQLRQWLVAAVAEVRAKD